MKQVRPNPRESAHSSGPERPNPVGTVLSSDRANRIGAAVTGGHEWC